MKLISPEELEAWANSGKEYQLIDVREPEEVAVTSMGGICIPMNEIPDKLDEVRSDIPVVIHCHSGMRSETVVRWIENNRPCDNLYSLDGGIVAWNEMKNH